MRSTTDRHNTLGEQRHAVKKGEGCLSLLRVPGVRETDGGQAMNGFFLGSWITAAWMAAFQASYANWPVCIGLCIWATLTFAGWVVTLKRKEPR
jgi:hypothetical protein